jgi:hypothetical protein
MTHSRASRTRALLQNHNLTLNNTPIPLHKNIRYLGVTFSQNCTLNQDLKETLKKTRNRANLLYRVRGRIRGCDPKTLLHTYKTFIRPITEYRSPLYASLYPASLNQLSACERRILRRIFRLHYSFPSAHLHQTTQTTSIHDRLQHLQKRYVIRTINSNNLSAIQTLSTSYKYPTRNGNLLSRIPKIPRRKLKHPPPHCPPLHRLRRATKQPPGVGGYHPLGHALTDDSSPVRPRTSFFNSSNLLPLFSANELPAQNIQDQHHTNTQTHTQEVTTTKQPSRARLRRRFFLLVFPFVHSANAGVLPEDGYRRTQFLVRAGLPTTHQIHIFLFNFVYFIFLYTLICIV